MHLFENNNNNNNNNKIVHGLRRCVEDHWLDNDFAVIKIDMKNAFNLVSREALLLECSNFFPELLPWATWCYGSQPFLFHSLGILTSESAVQQGDPLGPLFFALVLHRIVSSIDADDDCLNLLYQAWYLDDGVLAGSKSSLLRALTIIENIGPSLGIFINLSKCEVFCGSDTTMFPDSMKAFHTPNLDILGAPIGDYIHCAKFIASKRVEALKLLSRLQDVAVIDPQVAFTLLRVCGSFCRLAHIVGPLPPAYPLTLCRYLTWQ